MTRSTAFTRIRTLETVMTLVTAGDHPEVKARLRYATNEPFAVRLELCLEDFPAVEWVFARELLVEGVRLPSGQGDIEMYPAAGCVVIELRSPDGSATLLADHDALSGFADDMIEAVPFGREDEYYSIDAALSATLAADAPRPTDV